VNNSEPEVVFGAVGYLEGMRYSVAWEACRRPSVEVADEDWPAALAHAVESHRTACGRGVDGMRRAPQTWFDELFASTQCPDCYDEMMRRWSLGEVTPARVGVRSPDTSWT
jgi:hypothetical protein